MSTAAQSSKASKMGAPRMVPVMPNIRDGNPQQQKQQHQQQQQYKEDIEEEESELHDTVLNQSAKTAEETAAAPTSTNTMLIIVFGLIVIGLVALIVWMVMKSNKTEDDTDIKGLITPGNNIPPYKDGFNGEQYDNDNYISPQEAYAMQQEQMMRAMQQNMRPGNQKMQGDTARRPQTAKNVTIREDKNVEQYVETGKSKPANSNAANTNSANMNSANMNVANMNSAKQSKTPTSQSVQEQKPADQNSQDNEISKQSSHEANSEHPLLQGDDEMTEKDAKLIAKNIEELADNEQLE